MKRILLLSLLLLPIVALAQYPTFSNKQKLGVQTTGDGLIYRGGIHPNYYTPSNINNAYFYLDTTVSKLYLYSVGTWQQVYPTASDTLSLGDYLLKSDTLAMLLPYLRKSDTISLSNRINNKLSLADTASMLLPYLKLADTTSMLTPYFRDSDTTMLNLITRFNSKLNTTDTVSLSDRINLKLNPIDTISLSNRINIKLNPSDTVSLSNRINKKLDTLYVNYQTSIDTIVNKDTINITSLEAGTGINITNSIISLDTVLLDNVIRVQNIYVKNDENNTLLKGEAVYVTGANGTNILVKRASNISEPTSSKTLGIVMASIASKGKGYVIKEGLLEGLNTSAADSAGVPIWLGVNGALIYGLTNKPYAPNHLVYLGVVTRKHQNNGEIYVTVQNGFEIKELHDVQITDPVNKASLYYNSSQSLWRDTTPTLLVSDTVSMLSKYVNTYSNQTGINGDKTFNNIITIDSATVTGKLLVNTNISDAVKISSNTNSTNLELANNSNNSVFIKSSNKNMILQTDTTALVYLNGDNKKVGILTMTPQQELEVAGNVRIDSLNNNLVPFRLIGSTNNNDLTNVNLGQGLSFLDDTLKVDLTIIDTAIAASSITLTGHVTGTGSTNSTVPTIIGNGVVTNDMLAGSISDTKLNTITTAGKVSNSATTATDAYPYLSQANTIVLRNSSGDFGARNIIATNFYGNATTSTSSYGLLGSLNSNEILRFKSTNSPSFSGVINMTTPNIDFNVASTNLSQTFGGTQTFSGTASFTGNVTGLTSSVVGLGNVTNESKATMFTSPTFTGTVNGITKSMVGLSNVDNTSDLNKPISTATQTALNLKLNISDTSSMLTNYLRSGVAASTYQAKLNGTGFVKASGTNITYDNSTYLPLTGGTLSGNLYGINQGLSTNLTISDIIPGNSSPLFTTITTGPSSSETVRFGLNQSLSGGANMFMGGTQGLGGNPTNPNIFFTDSRKAYASIGGIHTSSGTNNQSGHIVFSTTPSVNTIALTERMRIAQDGAITMGGTLGVTGATNFKDLGNHTFVNYIQNGDFDLTSTLDASAFNYGYPHYIPLFWKSAATSRYVSRWSTTGGYNSSGVYQQYDGDSSTGGALYQDVVNWESLKGKTVTACGWFTKGSLVNTGNHAEIQIDDGVTTKSVGSIGTTTTWQRACVTKTISATATRVRVIVGCDLGHSNQGGAASDIDAISLVIGDGKHQFTPKPIFDSGNQRLAGSLTLGYDNEDNIAYNSAGTSTLKVASLSGTGTRMVVANNTGILSTQAIPSSGSGTVTNVSANPSTPNGLTVATGTTTPVISIALAANGITGVVSNTTQEFSGNKTFLNNINGSSALNVTGLSALNGGASLGTLATTSTLTRVLGINNSNVIGELSLGGGMSVGSGVLSIQAATGSQTGTVIHFGNQVFGGNKTFNGTVDISSTLTVGSTGTFGGRVKTLWLERSYANSTATSSTVSANITWLNIHQDAAVTLTLPDAATYPGKELIIKQTGAGIVSSSGAANIIGFTTRYDIGSPQNVIINPSTYRFATLVSDGTYWIIMQVN